MQAQSEFGEISLHLRMRISPKGLALGGLVLALAAVWYFTTVCFFLREPGTYTYVSSNEVVFPVLVVVLPLLPFLFAKGEDQTARVCPRLLGGVAIVNVLLALGVFVALYTLGGASGFYTWLGWDEYRIAPTLQALALIPILSIWLESYLLVFHSGLPVRWQIALSYLNMGLLVTVGVLRWSFSSLADPEYFVHLAVQSLYPLPMGLALAAIALAVGHFSGGKNNLQNVKQSP